jgi:2'-5' RNA ligase
MQRNYAARVRLFVSIRPSRRAVAHLDAALAGRRTSRQDQWHVTLALLGEVADPEVLRGPLGEAARSMQPFDVHLAGGSAFNGARAAWAGVGGDVEALSSLAAAVQQACRGAGAWSGNRRFRPHLTVGTTTRIDPPVLDGYAGPSWQVEEIELVQSVLGRTATHTVLERFPLYQA